jgi:GT2 family glycosyltransferase
LAELPRDVAPDAAAARIAQAESGQTFDLTRLPLIRFALYRVDAKEHWLVQAFHHVIFDALSAQYYFDELARRYEAAGRIETPPRQSELQHGDYAVWHRHMYRADGPLFAQSLSWWRNNLASSRALKLPFVRKSARADASPADGWIRFVILPETTRRLNALARAQSATPYTVRLAAFLALLGDETGQSDLSIGTYVSNRHRVVLQNMLGLIINLVTLRVRYDARRPFGEWLAMVGKRVGDVEAHGEIPQRLLDEAIARTGSALPPVEAIFSVSTNRRRFQIADIEVTENCRIAPPTMPWGFSLSLDEAVGGPGCRATFDARRYDPSAVRLFVERFSRLLDAVAQNPELIVSELLARSDTDPRRRSPDQVAELIARMRKLEAENERLRTILEREIAPRRHSLSEKFRPKIGSFHHHYPRDLKFPPSYQPESLPQPAPSFAIVTPSYNHAPFVAATIDSVLAQNYPALRYHVQDAGSSDGTTDILKSFGHRISWHSAPDRGQAHGINVGFGTISGDIMAYLNSDDLLSPGALAYVAGAFAAHPNVDFVYSHRICIDENGREIGRWVLPRHDRTAIKWFDFIPQETLFWRRRAWDALGGFDEKYHYALDWDFILRAHAKGMRFLRLPRFLGCFRVHEMQKTSDNFSVGQAETGSLRRIHLGFEPNDRTVARATAGYLRRHVLFHRLHKLRILKY